MKIVLISDTHDKHEQIKIPVCDVLIHAGDFTSSYNPNIADYVDFNTWIGQQPAKEKLIIAGNHDTLFERDPVFARSIITNATYLEDTGKVIEGLTFFGTPWTPMFNGWAFMKPDEYLHDYFQRIPKETNVLITHGPPAGVLDRNLEGENCGSWALLEAVKELPNLKLHVFGHIHESSGKDGVFVNASICDVEHNVVNEPMVIDI